jgi:hypothetical protein
MSDQEETSKDAQYDEHVGNGPYQNVSAWRLLLQQSISDVEERQRIAEYLHINAATLLRWSHGVSNPHASSLQALVDVLPFPRGQIIAAIQQEYPELSFHAISAYNMPQHISIKFYNHVLDAHHQLPTAIHNERMCSLILRQLLIHFDPLEESTAVYIAQCTPPRPGQKVRSLYMAYGMGSASCPSVENRHYFLGAESQTGNALQAQHLIMMPEYKVAVELYPSQRHKSIESAINYPLIHDGEIAGCLGVISTKPRAFSLAHLELVRQYANLLVLAFDRDQFYRPDQIELGIIPPISCQAPYLFQFRHRMLQYITQANGEQQKLSWRDASIRTWQEVEEMLLSFSGTDKA